jgi:hypothetical protein
MTSPGALECAHHVPHFALQGLGCAANTRMDRKHGPRTDGMRIGVPLVM